MNKIIAPILSVIALLALAQCAEKEDTTLRDLSLLYLATNRTGGLSPQQLQGATASYAATGAAGSAATGASMQASRSTEAQRLMAGLLENGFDPLYARQVGQKLAARGGTARNVKVVLAAFPDGSSGSSPNRSYTYSGVKNGVGKTTNVLDLSSFVGSACSASYPSADAGTPTGTATFTGGNLAWNGTGTSGSFTGTSTNTGTVTFSNYGVFYTDWFAYINLLRNPPAPVTSFNCAAFQGIFNTIFGILYKYAIVKSGALTYNVQTSFAAANSSSTSYSSNTNYTSTLNSASGIVITDNSTSTPGPDQTVVLENAQFGYSSNISIVGTPTSPTGIAGSMTLTMAGKVNGASIDQTFTVSF